jgi:hypothetical protein
LSAETDDTCFVRRKRRKILTDDSDAWVEV